MADAKLPSDAKWPRANSLFTTGLKESHIALVGIPAHKSSLSKTNAHKTPAAIRSALARYSTYAASRGVDLQQLKCADLGDISAPDFASGEAKVAKVLKGALSAHQMLIALGGDNSITYSVANGLFSDLSNIGIITLDAHHDLRDGESNGSPIWRLLQAGVPGKNIVQIGINDFANSREYTERAREYGITVINRAELKKKSPEAIMKSALKIAGKGSRDIYVDLDVDVCDRSVVPACPAAMPGGISADELREFAFLAGASKQVRAIDITEIDATIDSEDQRTVRLAALLVLEATAGFGSR